MRNLKEITRVLTFLFLFTTGFIFAQDKAISQNQLPKTAKNFLVTHFKDISIGSVIEDREIYGVDEYKVYLSNGTKIEFDRGGNWKEVDGEHQKLPYSFIPVSIRNYVTKSFPNTYIVKIEKERWSYKTELSNGVDLKFDKNGNFSKIDD